jgi:hypothetical protein
MDSRLMFLDCPAYLDRAGAQRCGLPVEVRCRFIMRSADGPLESAMVRCPAVHWFGPIEYLTPATPPPRRTGQQPTAGQSSGRPLRQIQHGPRFLRVRNCRLRTARAPVVAASRARDRKETP